MPARPVQWLGQERVGHTEHSGEVHHVLVAGEGIEGTKSKFLLTKVPGNFGEASTVGRTRTRTVSRVQGPNTNTHIPFRGGTVTHQTTSNQTNPQLNGY